MISITKLLKIQPKLPKLVGVLEQNPLIYVEFEETKKMSILLVVYCNFIHFPQIKNAWSQFQIYKTQQTFNYYILQNVQRKAFDIN